MCAITGIFAYSSSAPCVDEGELLRVREQMTARGPDGKGLWISSDLRVGLGHRRLAILDLSNAGKQPMSTQDGRFHIVFNGEIYNYRDLRAGLEAHGVQFHSGTDTEVLLHLYATKREAMIHDLRGMFAFAIWDSQQRVLFLARDPYGIKPLYYADDGNSFRFASQVKALIAGGSISDETDPSGLVGFYMFGSVPEPLTIYRSIKALPAGHMMIVDQRGLRTARAYHSIAEVYERMDGATVLHGSARRSAAREALLDSVKSHLVADVPVGAFLSAGIDSSALVGLMRDVGQRHIETVTLSFAEYEGSEDDEAPIAAEVARLYGTRHTTRVVTKKEFQADLPCILAAMDQPSIDGVNTWFVAKAARERGLKVAISGVGGDELFGGYPAFQDVPRWVGWLKVPAAVPGFGSVFRKTLSATGTRGFNPNPKIAGLIEYGGSYPGAWFLRRGLLMPWELTAVLDVDIVREGLDGLEPLAVVRAALDPTPKGSFAKVATMEASLYMRNQLLRDTDWASMAHSLEVRTPLVDAWLLERIAALGAPAPGSPKKGELASAPSLPLPVSVTTRKKTGFSTPLTRWMPDVANFSATATTYSYSRPWAQYVLSHHLTARPTAPSIF